MPSGAPAATAASSTSLAAETVHPLARGWGLMMMPLRVFRASSTLKMAVEVGLVVGITAPITPTGSRSFFTPKAGSSSTTPQVFTFL